MTFISENGVRKAVKYSFADGLAAGSLILSYGVFFAYWTNLFIGLSFGITAFICVILTRDGYIERAVNKVKEGNQ